MKQVGWSLVLLCMPLFAAAQATPDDVLQRYKARLGALGYQLPDKNYQASETLVSGIYAFWSSPKTLPFLTNENATILSENGGTSWKYVAAGLPELNGADTAALRGALISNARLGEMVSQRYGKGQRKLIYFTAFDCPYCNRFEQGLRNLKNANATLYAIPSNLDSDDPVRSEVVRSLWCSNTSWAEWEKFAQTRKIAPEKLRTDTSRCSPLRTSKQSWLLHRMLRGNTAVPFFIANDGWTGTPAAKIDPSELTAIFTPPKSTAGTPLFGQTVVDLSSWGGDRVGSVANTTAADATYQIGEGMRGSADTTAQTSGAKDLKDLKEQFKKVFK